MLSFWVCPVHCIYHANGVHYPISRIYLHYYFNEIELKVCVCVLRVCVCVYVCYLSGCGLAVHCIWGIFFRHNNKILCVYILLP